MDDGKISVSLLCLDILGGYYIFDANPSFGNKVHTLGNTIMFNIVFI